MPPARRWTEARALCPDSGAARTLARRLKRAGALHLWRQGREVRSLWPADAASLAGLEALAAETPEAAWRLRGFAAARALQGWLEPRPEPVGPGLALAPAWLGLAAGAQTLVIDPLTAFGSGEHPSTRLNLELLAGLAARVEPAPKAWLADVGSGSGILALGLALVARRPVVAVDPEPAAGRALARNRALNPLAAPLVHFVRGTHAALAGPFALAAANLPLAILRAAAPHLAGTLAPGAWLVASGFRCQDEEPAAEALAGPGLEPGPALRAQGWSAVAFRRPGEGRG
jgi:ribosomal protein L11 methyltransferase